MQTQGNEADIRRIIKEGYDIKKVEIFESTHAEFQRGFEFDDAPIENKGIAPGDFVIESKEPGKGKKLATSIQYQ